MLNFRKIEAETWWLDRPPLPTINTNMSSVQRDVFDESLRHRIFRTPFGVVKEARRNSHAHDVITQRRIHSLALRVLERGDYSVLFVPLLSDDQTKYEMALINTDRPIWLGTLSNFDTRLVQEVVQFWKDMYAEGFALLDFELYEQPSGRVALIDFDSTGFHMTGKNEHIHIPGKQIPPAQFFVHPCFTPDFEQRLAMRLPVGTRNISS